jgi:hypothetical protein
MELYGRRNQPSSNPHSSNRDLSRSFNRLFMSRFNRILQSSLIPRLQPNPSSNHNRSLSCNPSSSHHSLHHPVSTVLN